jgi:hypothetical protein
MDDFSVTKIPLHFQCHAVRVRPHAEGAWSDPFTPRLRLPVPSIAQSRSTGQFDTNPMDVQNRTESSMPSPTSRPSVVPPRFRSQSLKDLVDELPVYPFVHSPLKNIQREEMRSVTYEDLLTGAREKSPLRRQKVRDATDCEQVRAPKGADVCAYRVCHAFSRLGRPGRMNDSLFIVSASTSV